MLPKTRLAMLFCDRAIEGFDSPDTAFAVRTRDDPLPSGRSHPGAEFVVAEERMQRLDQGALIAGRYEKARFTLVHRLGSP